MTGYICDYVYEKNPFGNVDHEIAEDLQSFVNDKNQKWLLKNQLFIYIE